MKNEVPIQADAGFDPEQRGWYVEARGWIAGPGSDAEVCYEVLRDFLLEEGHVRSEDEIVRHEFHVPPKKC